MNSFDPFTAPEPPAVPLPHAPLVRVLVQVRFAPLLNLEASGKVGRLQDAIRGEYPVLDRETVQAVRVSPGRDINVGTDTAWRFNDEDRRWRASLTSEFLAIETTAYRSRSDFMQRTERFLEAVQQAVDPSVVTRVGVRYIDRIEIAHPEDIVPLLREEVTHLWTSLSAESTQALLTEALFSRGSSTLRARFGLVPANVTVDPSTIEAAPGASWLLDIDMFRSDQRRFDASSLVADVRTSAARIYAFFRWAVTERFLQTYGGTP